MAENVPPLTHIIPWLESKVFLILVKGDKVSDHLCNAVIILYAEIGPTHSDHSSLNRK